MHPEQGEVAMVQLVLSIHIYFITKGNSIVKMLTDASERNNQFDTNN